MRKKLLLATRNKGKLKELTELLRDRPVDILGPDAFSSLPECIEDGQTFLENATKKAWHYHKLTGLMALGDDSGLLVDALGGRPGVHSARSAGPGATDEQRINKLLDALQEVPDEKRTARFVCALALVDQDAEIFTIESACEGVIARAAHGTDGFGFDPIFLVPELGRTFAEMTMEEKNRLSHRGKALSIARRRLQEYLDNIGSHSLS
jgi:XTP/dITP diphosphohydrolase